MKSKCILFAAVLFCFSVRLAAQSFQHFIFKGVLPKDTITYQSFFVKFKDGTGFMRASYTAPDTKDQMIVELKMREQFVLDRQGMAINKFLYFKASGTEIIKGKSNLKFQPVLFWYKINTTTLLLEPWAVSNETAKKLPVNNNLLVSTPLQSADLKEDFVENYFLRKEDFFKALFDTRTKSITASERDVTLHLIVVANTDEKDIGGSCKNDMNRAILTFNDIHEFLGLDNPPVIRTVSGNKFSLKAVQDEITKLDPEPNDIVIFYYSGHGFRKPEDKRPYPYLDLRSKADTFKRAYLTKSLNIEDIYTDIKKKGARFTLVLSDCCNNLVTQTNKTGDPISETKDAGLDWSEDNAKKLFLNPVKQSIIATAAKEGQLATGNLNFGGFFSYFFTTAMHDHFSILKKDVSWEKILEQARVKTVEKAERTYCDKPYIRKNICRQIPVSDIK